MLKSNETAFTKNLQNRLLTLLLLGGLLVLLFKLQAFQSLLRRTPLAQRAVEWSLPAEHSIAGPQPGSIAPDFTLPSVNGKTVALRSVSSEKVLLVFAAPNCPDCRAAIQALLLVCPSTPNTMLVIMTSAELAEQAQGSCLQFLQGTNELSQLYGVVSVPTMYLLDAKRRWHRVRHSQHRASTSSWLN